MASKKKQATKAKAKGKAKAKAKVAPTRDDALPKIGAPATRALENIGVTTLSGVARMTEAELSALHGMGPKAIRILQGALKSP